MKRICFPTLLSFDLFGHGKLKLILAWALGAEGQPGKLESSKREDFSLLVPSAGEYFSLARAKHGWRFQCTLLARVGFKKIPISFERVV